MYICDEHGLHGKGDDCPKCIVEDMSRDKLIDMILSIVPKFKSKLHGEAPVITERHANQIIDLVLSTQPTNEKVIDVVKCLEKPEYGHTYTEVIKAIEKLYGDSDE